jgi:hypothetical protein
MGGAPGEAFGTQRKGAAGRGIGEVYRHAHRHAQRHADHKQNALKQASRDVAGYESKYQHVVSGCLCLGLSNANMEKTMI